MSLREKQLISRRINYSHLTFEDNFRAIYESDILIDLTMFSKKSDKARVSPCCGSEGDSPLSNVTPYTGIKRPGLYTGDCVKPAPGNLPSSKAC